MLTPKHLLISRRCLFDPTQITFHFVGKSGIHFDGYCTVDPILRDVPLLNRLTRSFTRLFTRSNAPQPPNVLVVTEGKSEMLADLTKEHLARIAMPAETVLIARKHRDETGRIIGTSFDDPDGAYEAISGRNVLIVDDLAAPPVFRRVARMVREIYTAHEVYGTVIAHKMLDATSLRLDHFFGLVPYNYNTYSLENCQAFGPCSRGFPIITDEGYGMGAAYQCKYPNLPVGFTTLRDQLKR